MKKRKKLIIIGVIALVIGVIYVDWVVYPFRTSHPNFSDVERVFARMQFPAEWQEVGSSENRGIAGRECPIESPTYCYHKSRTFKIPEATPKENVESILLQTGCPVVAFSATTTKGEDENSFNLKCSIDGLNVTGSLRGPENEAFISVRS